MGIVQLCKSECYFIITLPILWNPISLHLGTQQIPGHEWISIYTLNTTWWFGNDMQCIHAVCSFINTLTLLFVGIQLLNIRKTWSNNGLFGSCSTVWLHFDDPTGLASTSSYGWHCSDVDGALRKLQMLAWIGRGDVCLGSPVGVGLGCDFRTSQGASKIDSGFFFVYRKCISCQIWLFWVYIYIYIYFIFFGWGWVKELLEAGIPQDGLLIVVIN